MAKSSITPGAGVKSDRPSDSELPATQGSTAIVPATDGAKYDDPSRDVIHPYLAIIAKTGDTSNKFPRNTGQFVFENRLVLGDQIPGAPVGESLLKVIPIALRKFYVECKRDGSDLKYGDGRIPKRFDTANAANLAGYGIDFDSRLPNKVEEAGEALLLVSGPADDVADAFYIEVDGKFYAPALMTFRRGSFRGAWKIFNTGKTRAEARKAEVFGTVYDLTSKLEQKTVEGKTNTWFESRALASAKVSETGLANIRQGLAGILKKTDGVAAPTE